jgi:type IV pilus assembly protein PilE
MNPGGYTMNTQPSRQRGFTLIELLIVIVIVAILAAIAFPAYQDQVRKTRRSTAKGSLMELVQCAERFHTSNRTYVGFNVAAQCNVAGRTTQFYQFTVDDAAAQAFRIRATPIGDQATDTCGVLQINQADQRRYGGAGAQVECSWGVTGLI